MYGCAIIEYICTYIHIWNEKELGLIFYLIFRLLDRNCKILKYGGVPVQCKAVDITVRFIERRWKVLTHHARDTIAIDIISRYFEIHIFLPIFLLLHRYTGHVDNLEIIFYTVDINYSVKFSMFKTFTKKEGRIIIEQRNPCVVKLKSTQFLCKSQIAYNDRKKIIVFVSNIQIKSNVSSIRMDNNVCINF